MAVTVLSLASVMRRLIVRISQTRTNTADVLAAFLRKVYRGFDTSAGVEPAMWREVLRIINSATVEGLADTGAPPTHEADFYAALRHSNEVFAAFKVHNMGRLMADKLTGADGKLKPFGQWVEDVRPIASHHVGAWLRTEYDTSVIRAHNAADWRRFERDKDVMPNLRWMPTTSPAPESSHRAFWQRRLTLPVDDPFWNVARAEEIGVADRIGIHSLSAGEKHREMLREAVISRPIVRRDRHYALSVLHDSAFVADVAVYDIICKSVVRIHAEHSRCDYFKAALASAHILDRDMLHRSCSTPLRSTTTARSWWWRLLS